MSDHFAPITALAVLVRRSCEQAERANLSEGMQEQLAILSHRIGRIRTFKGAAVSKRIGVFGAPKRGKSTLLNALLGQELLPTSPVPLSTTTIEIERESSLENWELVVNHASGRIEQRDASSMEEVARLLEAFGSRRGALPAARLRLKGAFPDCRILDRGGVLLDTPGAELAFEAGPDLAQESKRALEALADTHVVLFCMRADQLGSRSDSEFYEQHIRSLAPVHVVTMRDKWQDDTGLLVDEVLAKYGLAQSEPVLVSAKLAQQAGGDAVRFLESGIPALEDRILAELDRLSPEHGLLPCLKAFQLTTECEQSAQPESIHFKNLHHAIKGLDTDWCRSAWAFIEKNVPFWKI
jgi:GTPase Era involved in 16S rRNA processing